MSEGHEEKVDDTKGEIRSRKSKDKQYSCQNKQDKRTNNDLQNTTQSVKNMNSGVTPYSMPLDFSVCQKKKKKKI